MNEHFLGISFVYTDHRWSFGTIDGLFGPTMVPACTLNTDIHSLTTYELSATRWGFEPLGGAQSPHLGLLVTYVPYSCPIYRTHVLNIGQLSVFLPYGLPVGHWHAGRPLTC